MWDSAKKPMKIRSIIRPDGTKHYLLGENDYEVREIINLKKKARARQNSKKHSKVFQTFSNSSLTTFKETTDPSDTTSSDSNGSLEINGNKFHNKLDYDKQLKESVLSLCQIQPSLKTTDKTDTETAINFNPKGAILNKARSLSPTGTHSNSRKPSLNPENELCSRILNWIDLEVRKNGIRNLTSISQPNLKEIKASGISLNSSTNSILNLPSSDSEPTTSENNNASKNKQQSKAFTEAEYGSTKVKVKEKKKVQKNQKNYQMNLTLNQNFKNEKKDNEDSNLWGEIKLKNTMVYLMGETKSRSTCKILVPEEIVIKQTEKENQLQDLGANSIVNSSTKPQLHIFLPVTNCS